MPETVLATVGGQNWAAINHAYGPATDIPGLLSLLESDRKSDRADAMYEFYGNVWHQGSRYPASAAIVPFLAALAANRAIHDRDQIVRLLCDIALGHDHYFLPNGVDIVSWRQKLEDRRHLTVEDERRKFDEWVAESLDEETREKRERVPPRFGAALKEMENSMSAYDAVQNKALPTLCDLLQHDPDAKVRAEAAHAVAFFPESSDRTLHLLYPIVFEDSNSIPEGLLATAIVSFVLLFASSPSSNITGSRTVEQRLHQFLTHQDPSLRWAAAVGLSRLKIVDISIINELASAITNPPAETEPQIPFYIGALGEYAMKSLESACKVRPLPESTLQSAIAPLLDLLSSPNTPDYEPILSFCCEIFWKIPQNSPFSQHPQTTFENLRSDKQKRLVRKLAELPSISWECLEGTATFKAWNLPPDRDACRRYVGLPEEGPYKRVIWKGGEYYPGS